MSMPNLPPQLGTGVPAGINPSAVTGNVGQLQQFGDLFRRVGRWLWIPGWSLPAQGAALTAFVLITSVTIVWIIFQRDPISVPWRFGVTSRYLGVLISLVLVIPCFVYAGLKLLVDGDRAVFADIDYAWYAGLSALRSNGLAIDRIPIYLILGTSGESQEIDLLRATGKGFRVRGVPEGPAALHWFAHTDAIYVCCTEASVVSALSRLALQHAADVASGRGALAGQDAPLLPVWETGGAGNSARPLNVLSMTQLSAQTARLRTMCRLLRIARDPICPLNGVMVLLPYDMVHATPPEIQQLAEAVEADLQTLRRTLQIRVPVTAVVTGLDNHAGFRELMRRVGAERTMSQRFGQHFDLRGDSSADELQRFSQSACGTFDDWAQMLFREPDVLSRPGNLSLFALVCQVRSRLMQPLGQVLARGFGYVPSTQSSEQRNVFSGCYFVAAGRSSDRQAFVRGVVEQMETEQDAVEWLPSALRRDRRMKVGLTLAAIANIALLVLLAYQIVITRLP